MTRQRSCPLHVWLSSDEMASFDAQCSRDDISRSDAVRWLLAEYAAGRNASTKIHQKLSNLYKELQKLRQEFGALLATTAWQAARRTPALNALRSNISTLQATVDDLSTVLKPYRRLK